MATITELLNSISGLTFRQTVNDNFTSLNAAKSETTHNHDTTYAAKAYEATVDTNTTDIAALDTRLTAEEGKYTYDYNKITSHTVTNDVYENVCTLTTPSRPAGTYKFSASMIYSLNSTTSSAFFRYSLDGGSTWLEIRREPKDNTDKVSEAYFTTVVLGAPAVTSIVIQARKEVAGDVLEVFTMDVAFERVA